MATLTVRFYAQARAVVGQSEVRLAIDPSGISSDSLVEVLTREYPRLVAILPTCRIVRNGTFVSRTRARFAPNDELAIHPPYSGG